MKPLSTPNELGGNPEAGPDFGVEAKRKSGETLNLVDPRSTRALVALMDMESQLGGAASHYGGPAAFAEIMSAAYGLAIEGARAEGRVWHEDFHIINDAGHCENGVYALRANYGMSGLTLDSLKGFRSVESVLTGHGEAHLFPEGVYLSNGPLGSSASQAQGLAVADKLRGSKRVTLLAISDGACMEGEAKEAFSAIPGLAQRGQLNPFVMMISDNDTKLSGRITKDAFSMSPSFAALETMGWKVLKVEQGNDLTTVLHALEDAISEAQKGSAPVAVWYKTTKGIGNKKCAESDSGGHGFPLKKASEIREFVEEIYQGDEVPAPILRWVSELEARPTKSSGKVSEVISEKIQVGISKAMIEMAEAGMPVVSVTSDLPGSTGVAAFRKMFPQSSFDVGVAESNMVSMAAGLSKEGYIPFVDTFAQFGVTKGALPLIMANLSKAPVICVFSHTGFQDAADGASHQALSYFAMMNSVAHTRCYSLSCSDEAYHLTKQAIEEFADARRQGKTPDSIVFFLGRENFPRRYSESVKYRLGEAQVVHQPTGTAELVIAANGSLIPEALAAAEELQSQNIGSYVVNTSAVTKVDIETFSVVLEKSGGRLLTVEDHQKIGGMGGVLTHSLLQQGLSFRVRSLGVEHIFGQSAYKASQLYEKHNIGCSAIVSAAQELVK